MSQVTIYIDRQLEEKIKKMAQETGVSISKFISKIVEQNVSGSWNSELKALAGSWEDFPTAEQLRDEQRSDTPREPL